MIGVVSAQVALFAFAVGIGAGVYAGNAPVTVLGRALTVMVVALLVSQAVAYASKAVIREYLVRRKLEIDRSHVDMLSALEAAEGEPEAAE
jgi:hypothetical protein